ncbi:hypothetical protein WJX82_006399 [Trebouxia sp. C0006]
MLVPETQSAASWQYGRKFGRRHTSAACLPKLWNHNQQQNQPCKPSFLDAFTERQTRWRAGEATSCFGEGLLCNKCITVSKQPMLFKGPCDTCSITGAPGWHKSSNLKICRWCYPRLPVITPGMTLSNIHSNMLDKGKKSAASVTDKHSSEAPCPSPSDESNHPKQPVDQQENGDDTRGVKKRKRSRKPSSVDVHRKGSQRQRCQSASCKDPEQSPSQIPGLAGIPKPQRYRDINTLTMELRLADSLPRKPQEPGRAVGGQPQERVSAEKGATTLLSSKLRNNRMTPKQALEWGVRHLEAVLADPKWLEA